MDRFLIACLFWTIKETMAQPIRLVGTDFIGKTIRNNTEDNKLSGTAIFLIVCGSILSFITLCLCCCLCYASFTDPPKPKVESTNI